MSLLDGKRGEDELELQLEEAEKKVNDDPRLWQREFAAICIRSVRKELLRREDGEALELRCSALSARLRTLDDEEFEPLRDKLAAGSFGPQDLMRELGQRPPFEWDAYVERLLDIHEAPRPELERQVNMVHYVASPFEAAMDVADGMNPDEVLYDMGCGLAKVSMVVSFFTGARTVGVDLEPHYIEHARKRVERFRFDNVKLIQADARTLDYEDATAFYFYDPFRGPILEAVLQRVQKVAERRSLLVYSRGDSTKSFEQLDWMKQHGVLPSEVTVFETTLH